MRDLPYMTSVKNLADILRKIKVAQTPPRFTHEFLKAHLGFSSSNDRAVVKVLKALGFLTADARPTERYNRFRSEQDKSVALADGLREGWAEIFLSDAEAYRRTSSELVEIHKNVTGKSESVAKKMATTFKTLAEQADFIQRSEADETGGDEDQEPPQDDAGAGGTEREKREVGQRPGGFSLHHDVHVHLPATSDVAVYTAIFRALREELLD